MNAFANRFAAACLLVLLAVAAGPARAAMMNPGLLPLHFEASQDQAGAFIARGHDSQISISPSGTEFVLRQTGDKTASVHMEFLGSPSSPRVYGGAELAGKINYFTGGNPSNWRTGIPTFQQVHIDGIYPGVNATYYGNEQNMEYDLDLAAGACPSNIVIRFAGADKLSVNPQGELEIILAGGTIFQHRPVAYQVINGAHHDVSAAYHIINVDTVTFTVGDYDRSQPLVIDPAISITFSTFFGGNHGETGYAIAVDSAGYIYVAGQTFSTLISNAVPGHYVYLATPGAFQTNYAGGTAYGDAFVAKFYPNGTNFVYFTYLGGSQDDIATGVAVDSAGNAYVAGFTDSANFPITNATAIQTNIGPLFQGQYLFNAFVTELNPAGSKLVYSTFLGGNAEDFARAIAVDKASGTVYVVGGTSSTNFPIANKATAFQSTMRCTNTYFFNANAFLAEIAPGGTSLMYSSFFGGTNFDEATSVALDSSQNIYVAGITFSTDFPTNHPLPTGLYLNGNTNKLQPAKSDAFVAEFTPNFGSLVYSTFLGGSNVDVATGIAADNSQNAYVVGWTASTNFPVTTSVGVQLFSALHTNTFPFPIMTNAFLAKLSWNGSALSDAYSQVFGGDGVDVANGVALNPTTFDIYVIGSASSTNYPCANNTTTTGFSSTNSSIDNFGFYSDVVITTFKSDLSALLYSTYMGGAAADYGYGIAADSSGNAYITGQTLSTNFPSIGTNAWTQLNNTNDAFLAKIDPPAVVPSSVPVSSHISGGSLFITLPSGVSPGGAPLYGTTNLTLPNWTLLNVTPVLTNGLYTYIVPFSKSNQHWFYRVGP